MGNFEGRELDWNDTIEKDGGEFLILPDGDYDFTVESYDRGRFNGSDKMPPCNKAILKVVVHSDQGDITLTHSLLLHTKTEGLLSEFFAGIGQKKKGERATMNWNAVPGSKGRCKIGIRAWKGNDGEDHKSNEIKKFYPKEAPSAGNFTPGKF